MRAAARRAIRRQAASLGRAVLGPPGAALAALAPRWPGRRVFCLFGSPEVGGAERVHAEIVAAIDDSRPVVVFTKPHAERGALLGAYARGGRAAVYALSPRRRRYLRGYLDEARVVAEINGASRPIVFGAFNHLFYQLLPRLGPHVRVVDLIHNFGLGYEVTSLAHVARIDARVVLAETFAQGLAALYAARGLEGFAQRVRVIANAVELPPLAPKGDGPLRVVFVGRPAAEKRVALVGAIATALHRRGVEARFTLIGVDPGDLREADRARCRCLGLVVDRDTVEREEAAAHVVLLTSRREGLPLALLEGMARAAVPVVAAVGGIPEHVAHGVSGFLLPPEPAASLVGSAADALERLAGDRALLTTLGRAARAHAEAHFTRERFTQQWRHAVLGPGWR